MEACSVAVPGAGRPRSRRPRAWFLPWPLSLACRGSFLCALAFLSSECPHFLSSRGHRIRAHCVQIQNHIEVLGVRASTQELWGHSAVRDANPTLILSREQQKNPIGPCPFPELAFPERAFFLGDHRKAFIMHLK